MLDDLDDDGRSYGSSRNDSAAWREAVGSQRAVERGPNGPASKRPKSRYKHLRRFRNEIEDSFGEPCRFIREAPGYSNGSIENEVFNGAVPRLSVAES